MLPLIIISLMLLVLDREKTLENKTVYSDNKEISYPFFGIEEIDNYIDEPDWMKKALDKGHKFTK